MESNHDLFEDEGGTSSAPSKHYQQKKIEPSPVKLNQAWDQDRSEPCKPFDIDVQSWDVPAAPAAEVKKADLTQEASQLTQATAGLAQEASGVTLEISSSTQEGICFNTGSEEAVLTDKHGTMELIAPPPNSSTRTELLDTQRGYSTLNDLSCSALVDLREDCGLEGEREMEKQKQTLIDLDASNEGRCHLKFSL